jgi:hypothetical protein
MFDRGDPVPVRWRTHLAKACPGLAAGDAPVRPGQVSLPNGAAAKDGSRARLSCSALQISDIVPAIVLAAPMLEHNAAGSVFTGYAAFHCQTRNRPAVKLLRRKRRSAGFP